MAITAECRYHCPNCQAELQQEGFVAIDAHDQAPLEMLLEGEVNLANCPECGTPSRLPIPLLYHNGEQELLISYVPNAAQLSPEELSETINYPYGMTVTAAAENLGIQLPEPDDAAFPRGEEHLAEAASARFTSLTHEQAATILPAYLLRPTIVDGFEVLVAVVQAVRDGMSTQEVLDDMSRLQLINGVINAPDPITRRKVLHHNEPYLNNELYEVIDTLRDQLTAEGSVDVAEKLQWVRGEVERYKKIQQERLHKRPAKK